jgi:hypothetical protein
MNAETAAAPKTEYEPLLVPDLDADPMADIPAELLDQVGAYDRDTAGGCG